MLKWISVILLAAGLTIAPPAAAADDPPSCPAGETPQVAGDGWICVPAVDPGSPGEPGSPGGGTGGGNSGCFSSPGHQIPCTMPGGYVWFHSHFCYASSASAIYPANEFPGYWQGHTDGSLWMCNGVGPTMAPASPDIFWVAAGAAPALVDPTVLAQRALDRMPLAKPEIHMAPTPPEMTYVGLDTWLWMDENQFDTLTMTVSAGGASVTVTAAVARAWWDMGDGDGASCASAGRPWVKGMTSAERTDCFYAYSRVSDFESDRVFPLAVNLVYQVDWTCTGPCLTDSGSLGEVDGPIANGSMRVGERQSVVIGGNH